MYQKIVFIFSLIASLNVTAQKSLSAGATLLFTNVKSVLAVGEKNEVFKKTGFVLSKDKKQFAFSADVTSMEYPFDARVLPTDLNKDGKEEVFIVFGNSYTSGQAGSNVLLFIKDKAGTYQANFGFSGTAPDILPTGNLGYPDLLIGGPGLEFPVWRWNGKEYTFNRKISDQALAKMRTTGIEEASKIYVGALK